MPEEPISNPNPPPSDPHPVNGGATLPNGGATEQPAANAGAAAAALTQLEDKDMMSYLLLRQNIDLFEATAIGFYATGKTVEARANRAEEVQLHVANFKNNFLPDGCGAGLRDDGHGHCVPNDALTIRNAEGGGGNA
jgi:hypothetical protein